MGLLDFIRKRNRVTEDRYEAIAPRFDLPVGQEGASAGPGGIARANSKACLPAVARRPRTDGADKAKAVWYVTDLHLDHRLAKEVGASASVAEAAAFAGRAAQELVESAAIDFKNDILLVGGDTAASPLFWGAFFSGVRPSFLESSLGSFVQPGPLFVVACLGNHELFAAPRVNEKAGRLVKTIEDVVAEYGGHYPYCSVTVLENALLLVREGFAREVWDERRILEASDQELSAALHDSSTAVLGGIGFTGLEPVHNASMGYYGNLVATVEEDRARSAKMAAVHDKGARCGSDVEVVVLTHTPAKSWLPGQPIPGWV